jgi:hypothetical protein
MLSSSERINEFLQLTEQEVVVYWIWSKGLSRQCIFGHFPLLVLLFPAPLSPDPHRQLPQKVKDVARDRIMNELFRLMWIYTGLSYSGVVS